MKSLQTIQTLSKIGKVLSKINYIFCLIGAMILCIGQMVLAKFAENYFAHELAVGTPFTQDGANEMLRLGILTICIPLGCLILAEIVSGIIAGFLNCDDLLKIENGGSVTLGVMFIVMSVLCRYGAELEANRDEFVG